MSVWLVAWLLLCVAVVLVSGVYYLRKEAKAELPPSDDQRRLIRNRIVVYIVVFLIAFSCIGWILIDMSR